MKHIFLRSALLIALFVCSTLTVQSQTLYEKELARGAGYRERAEQEAQQGNVVAMYDIAYNCRWGQAGYAKDFKRAMELCLKASEFGYPFAQDLIANMYVTGSGVEQSKEKAYEWYSKALENLKRYADQGNVMAMNMLGGYYDGRSDSRFEDEIKALYWHLRALECGAVVAYGIGADYASGYGAVEKDENFALAWYARFCLDYEKNYKLTNDEVAKLLSDAGYIRSEWEALAEPTYISVPRIASNDEEQIKEVMLLTLDILDAKAEEFRAKQRIIAANRPGAGQPIQKPTTTSSSTTYASSQSSSSHATSKSTASLTSTQRREPRAKKLLSTISQIAQAAVGISTGNATIGTNSAANVLANDSRLSEVRQLFSYSGTDRQGQTDASGKVIQNELSTSDALGETHYVFYEDKYCFITTLSTCLQCYGNRVCRLCNGHGSFVHPYLQQLSPCKVCGGTGVCLSCNGQGYRLTAKMWRPGEAEAYVQALREVKRSHYSGSSSSHSHSHSSSSSGVCPDCGGTGYRPEVSPVAMPSNVASYHHTAGYECYICGRSTDHYHHRCTTCKQH